MKRRKPTPKQIRDSATRAAFRKGWEAGWRHVHPDGPVIDLVYTDSPFMRLIQRGTLAKDASD